MTRAHRRSGPKLGSKAVTGLVIVGLPSRFVRLEPALQAKQVEADAEEDDHEHCAGHRCAHRWVAQLELEAEKRPVEKRAHEVGRELRSGHPALDGVDKAEGVEVAGEGGHGPEPAGGAMRGSWIRLKIRNGP